MQFKDVKIDIRKLRDYCLNPGHPLGKHKARMFLKHLHIKQDEASVLLKKMKETALKSVFKFEYEDQYGKRYSADLNIKINDNHAIVKTYWIIGQKEQIPSLVTCYVKI